MVQCTLHIGTVFGTVYRTLYLSILMSLGTVVFGGEKDFFEGGSSDISSSDPNRAAQAIRKWSRAGGKQDDQPLSGAPYHWDYTKVGRPVFLRIIKNDNTEGRLEVWLENPKSRKYEHFKTYAIAYFSGDLGPKMKEGDRQAPEGFYYINRRRMNPRSRFHLSMDVGYPNTYDRAKNRTGSFLMIHGSVVSVGCFAMTDCSIEQIYTLVDRALAKGQRLVRVHSFPFAMTDENLESQRDSPHYSFWKNLKEGWDWFEKHKRPPNVEVEDGEYTFSKL